MTKLLTKSRINKLKMDEVEDTSGGRGKSGGKNQGKKKVKAVKHTARVERILKNKEAKIVENTKQALIMRGNRTSQVIINVLTDIASLVKPNCKLLSKKNEILPFEDANSIEFLTVKNDASLFALGSHTKKRPHNLIIGRTYDGHIFDMIEFGIDKHSQLTEFRDTAKKNIGSKPMMLFQGDQWDTDSTYGKIQNLLLDFFRLDKIDKISLKGLDHVIVCTVIDGIIYLRAYIVRFKKSGTKIPNVELYEMGPSIDMSLRRTHIASEDLWKAACKRPKVLKVTKVKNITKNNMGDKIGRIHMKKQNIDKMGGKRVSVLRNKEKNNNSNGTGNDEY